MKKKYSIVFLVIILLVFFTSDSYASSNYKMQILGDSTQSSQLEFPAVSSGPGLILPNNPLYQLDNLFQQIKIFAARTPEDKAKVRSQIAGERLAELKLMLDKNDQAGIDNALSQISKDNEAAALELKNAAENGENVEEAAKNLNETIKSQRDVLDVLSEQSDGEMKLKFKAARESAKASKVKVDDHLPPQLLEKEVQDDLEAGIDDNAEEIEHSTTQLEDRLDALQEQATEAAKKSQEKRLEAIKKAMEINNENLKKQAEKELKAEKLKQEAAKKQQEILREKAKKAAEAAKEIKEQSKQEESHSDSGSGSSSSGNSNSGSGSGSDNSGGGNSGSGHDDDN